MTVIISISPFLFSKLNDVLTESYRRILHMSQNVFRDTNVSKQGIIGCLTPTGFPFLTTRGGRILEIEALILQSLPISQLDLSCLDLAGNAMTSTVVGVCALSAISLFYKKFDFSDSPKEKYKEFQPDLVDEDILIRKFSSTSTHEKLSCAEAIYWTNLTRKL